MFAEEAFYEKNSVIHLKSGRRHVKVVLKNNSKKINFFGLFLTEDNEIPYFCDFLAECGPQHGQHSINNY
jgi:hypothetical protein